jgi:hypothetical protein
MVTYGAVEAWVILVAADSLAVLEAVAAAKVE